MLAATLVGGGALAAPALAVKDELLMVSRASDGAGASANSFSPDISGDGRFVVFDSDADNLAPDDVDTVRNVHVRNVRAGTTTLVSRASGASGAAGDSDAFDPSISADGRYVAFESASTTLTADGNPGTTDVFVRDLVGQTTTLVSRDTGANGPAGDSSSFDPVISADGRHVAFTTAADNFSAEDDDSVLNVYVRDLTAQTTTLVSRATGAGGAGADGISRAAAISGDGRRVAFESVADNLSAEDDDAVQNVFVRDVVAGTTTLVSRATGAAGAGADVGGFAPDISADGRLVVFHSGATNLSAEDGDPFEDVFLRDLDAQTTTLVSRAAGGGAGGDGYGIRAAISDDGRHVAFISGADNLSPDDGPPDDVFARDLQTGGVTFVSRGAGAAGPAANGSSSFTAISADGRYVAFSTVAENLAPVGGVTSNVFWRDVLGPTAPATTASNLCAAPGPPPAASRPPGRVRLTRQQLRINQRIGQTAIRRLAAVQAWPDARIATRDICGGGFGPADLAAGIVAEPRSGRLALLPPADPRPITVASPGVDARVVFTLTPAQLLINQRIYQAAVRRANGLQVRLDSGLTGGDVRDGAITQGLLHDRLAVVLAPAGAAVPRSATVVAPPGRGRPAGVELSARQLRINQRVAQAGVRRANALIAELSTGVDGRDLRDGSIGAADLAPGVVAP